MSVRRRIRAHHPASGSTLTAEVTETLFERSGEVSYRVIPDGLLESVIIRDRVWDVTEEPNRWPERPARAGANPVLWNDMSVTFRDHAEPSEAEDGDRWERPDGTYVRRGGEWVRR